MSTITGNVPDQLARDFARARLELLDARQRQAVKDGPRSRAVVSECCAEIDSILDRYLLSRRTHPRDQRSGAGLGGAERSPR
jgi:hypothetical protein